MEKKRDLFGTRWGFILACIGSAVGMGNIWMFPTRVSKYGGGTFLLWYFFFVVLIGSTAVSYTHLVLGATGITMDFGETYGALQNKAIDRHGPPA